MIVIDPGAHPRILFEDVPDDVYDDLAPLAGTAGRVDSAADIHPSDWDLVVTFAANAGARSPSLHVLSFGAQHAGKVQVGEEITILARAPETKARGVTVAAGASGDAATLLQRTLRRDRIPDVKTTWAQRQWSYNHWYNVATTGDLGGACAPLLHIGEEKYVYALIAVRGPQERDTPSIVWALPSEVQGHREWLLYVLEKLRVMDPDRFPSDPSWQSKPIWATPQLRAALARRDELEALWRAAQEEHERVLVDVGSTISEETEAASDGPWRLLTEDGDGLVKAVVECLEALGFTVREMDDHHDEKTGAKLEDLRVADPDVPDWLCLVEVKGYTNGARARDMAKILGRPWRAYVRETGGDDPPGVWHIVNVHRGQDPTTRAAVPDDPAMDELADANGALIDTRQLFLTWRRVMDGDLDASAARGWLRAARRRWDAPLAPEPDTDRTE